MKIGTMELSVSSSKLKPNPRSAPANEWVPIGSNSRYCTVSAPNNGDTRDFELRCTVTDGSTQHTSYISVSYN